MPAIQPARLKKQTADLAAKYNQPAVFVRDLHSLLDRYTDHTHRKGQAGEPSPLMSAYKTPPPVMRQMWLELMLQLTQQPSAILPLIDALWTESNYDLQLLAARLLGQVPVIPHEPIIERLVSWVNQEPENRILDCVFEFGTAGLRRENPDKLLELISRWLASPDLPIQQAGLRALGSLVGQSGTGHLPTIYRLLTPYLRIAPSRLRPDILAVLSDLVKCSPAETAYLLRQNLTVPDNPDTAWIIRQVLNEFPADLRAGLRQALKSNS